MALDPIAIPFNVQTAEDHTAELIFSLAGLSDELTDLNPGGIARSLMEAAAIQFEKLDTKVFFGIERAIPSLLYTGFNFPLLGAVKATGTVTFTRTAGTSDPITIPVDTVVKALATAEQSEVVFTTIEEKTLVAGENSVDVPVAADVAGPESNVSAGRITVLPTPIPDIASIVNFSAIKNGRGPETEEEREIRFRLFVKNLARSTLGGIESGAMTAQIVDINGIVQERVVKAIAIEPVGTLGRVRVWLDNGGGTASASLVAEAQKIIDGFKDSGGNRVAGYKAAGIVAEVLAIQSVPINVSVAVEIDDGFNFNDVKAEVQDGIENFFLDLGPGDELIVADLLCAIVGVPGVRDAILGTPAINENADSSQRLLAGTIIITNLV